MMYSMEYVGVGSSTWGGGGGSIWNTDSSLEFFLVSVRVTVLRLPLETAIFVIRIPILFQIS